MATVSLPFALVKISLHLLADHKRREFIEACKNPAYAQSELKKKILANAIIPFPDGPTDYKSYDGKNLTHEKVKFFETTSGSTGAKKQIPYTKSLLNAFQNMFLLWAHDLVFHSGLRLKSGKFFMSVSPKIGDESGDDRKYLSPVLNFLLSPFLVSHPDNHHAKTGDDFLEKVATDLKKAHDLEIISVWSPTYLLSLLEKIPQPEWPELKLISCWADAQAEKPADILEKKFPGVMIQGKGLLSTEAPITIPWTEAGGQIPLLTETLIELLDGDEIIPLHEAKLEKEYIVLTSQFNGYLRYNTQDRVRITGHYFKTPIFKFLGRTGQTCDLAGEKFSDEVLREIFPEHILFVPQNRRYVVLTSSSALIEQRLLSIFHYDLARKLRQLDEVKVFQVKNPSEVWQKFCQSQGMRLGDIKERILISDLKQAEKFLAWLEKEYPSSH